MGCNSFTTAADVSRSSLVFILIQIDSPYQSPYIRNIANVSRAGCEPCLEFMSISGNFRAPRADSSLKAFEAKVKFTISVAFSEKTL